MRLNAGRVAARFRSTDADTLSDRHKEALVIIFDLIDAVLVGPNYLSPCVDDRAGLTAIDGDDDDDDDDDGC